MDLLETGQRYEPVVDATSRDVRLRMLARMTRSRRTIAI